MKPKFIIFAALVLTGAMSACGDTKKGDIRDEYADNVRKIGLNPVYPPREDLQVGDVYMVSIPKTNAGELRNPNDTISIYIGSDKSLLNSAASYLGSRVVFEKTNAFKVAESDKSNVHQNDLYSGDFGDARGAWRVRSQKAIQSLPIVAFPSIDADAGVTASVGVVRALHAFGLAGGARTKVRLDFNDVRKYGAPAFSVSEHVRNLAIDSYSSILTNELNGFALEKRMEREIELLRQQKKARGSLTEGSIETDLSKRCYTIRVITNVYLTRRISYTYSNARIISAALKRAEKDAEVDENVAKVTIPPTVVIQNVVPAGAEAPAVGVSDSNLSDLQGNVVSAVNSQTVGDGLQFQSWNALGVTFSQEYERPVAIAYNSTDFVPPARPGAPNPSTIAELGKLPAEQRNFCTI